MYLISGIIILIFLFTLSAFWSGSETALTSLSKYRIKKIIALKKTLAEPLMQWLKSPYYLLTAVLVGNTVTNLVLSSLATLLVLHTFTDFTFFSKSFQVPRALLEFLTWITVTFLLLVFGEITPKIFSRYNAEKVTIFSLPILFRVAKIAGPVSWPVRKFVKIIFPKANLATVGHLTFLSLEEIRELISEANTTGLLGKETSQMLERVLKLGGMNVSKIMTTVENIEAVDIDQDPEKFLDKLIETGQSRVPVYHGSINKISGFVHTKDLLWEWQQKHSNFTEDMVRPPYFVTEDKKIYDLLKEFQSGKTHMAFVTDALGNLIGLVTLEDVLEEIVGEILDEYDLEDNMEKEQAAD